MLTPLKLLRRLRCFSNLFLRSLAALLVSKSQMLRPFETVVQYEFSTAYEDFLLRLFARSIFISDLQTTTRRPLIGPINQIYIKFLADRRLTDAIQTAAGSSNKGVFLFYRLG